jgi:iron complex outermembrane receptor protein
MKELLRLARMVVCSTALVATVFHVRLASAQTSSTSAPTNDQLQEVVVTAQKQREQLIDVPGAVSAISGEQLEALGVSSLSDLASYVPGLAIQDGGAPGARTIVIRGLSTGFSQPTGGPLVATYIDDAPVGATAGLRADQFGIDLMPYDLDRIEVLRGPQGTLYGAGAMGGIIKYVLKDPDLTRFDARVGADTEYVANSSGLVGVARSAVNLPIIADTLGVRVSGFYKADAGYIDNVGVGVKDSNHSTQYGGRFAVLWNVTDQLSVRGTFLVQNSHQDDVTGVTYNGATNEPLQGRYDKDSEFLEPFEQRALFGSLTIDWNFNFAKLTSTSSWSQTRGTFVTSIPSTGFLVGLFVPAHADAIGYSIVGDNLTKYTEELRLASENAGRLQWMVGAFYNYELPLENYSWPTFTPAKVSLPYNVFEYSALFDHFVEQAVFANATYKFTDSFDISAGVRYAKSRESTCDTNAGLLNDIPDTCMSRPFQGATTWSADARYHLDKDAMVYLKVATGYRAGGFTGVPQSITALPQAFKPDTVTNYEVGFKGEFLDHRWEMDVAAFYIDWRSIQSTIFSPLCSCGYSGNGGTASSGGLEFETAYQVTSKLRVNATLAYTLAKLTQDAPAINGNDGDQLTNAPRVTASLTADYRQPVGDNMFVALGGGYRYRDAIVNQFPGTVQIPQPPYPLGPQNIVDLYGGIGRDKLSARIFLRNVFNNQSFTGLLGLETQNPTFVPITPRTVGLSVDYHF